MAVEDQRFCNHCGKHTLHRKPQMISDGVGCLATILTGGLFLIVWLPLGMIDTFFQRYRCQNCGEIN